MARIAPPTTGFERPVSAGNSNKTLSQAAGDCQFLRLLAASPAVLEAFLAAEKALSHGELTARQRELIALVVAEIHGSTYGLSAHYAAAKKAGVSDEQIKFARKATSSDPTTDAMLRFAQAVTLQRGDISDADFRTLRNAGLTDGQIAEVIANVALNVFANYFNTAVKTEVDFPLVKPGSELPAVPPPHG